MPVELAAVVVYVTDCAPWHLVDVPGEKALMVTIGIIVTRRVVVTGPLHPAALAVMVVVPPHAAAKVTTPVEEIMLLPAKAAVVASKLYVIPVELDAVVEYITVSAPLQRVEVGGEKADVPAWGNTQAIEHRARAES